MDLERHGRVVVKVAGEDVMVDRNANVLETVKRLVREHGLGNPVQVIVDGEEVMDPQDLPDVIGEHIIELRRYAKAG